jgi:hypothetical protein
MSGDENTCLINLAKIKNDTEQLEKELSEERTQLAEDV